MKKTLLITLSFCLVVFLSACSVEKQEQPEDKHSNIPTIKELWKNSEFNNPESAKYDAKNNIIYVSNLAGGGMDKDGVGFISKLDLNGKMVELEWVTGLSAPKGMGIYNDTLYVSDIDKLVAIDIATGEILDKYTIPSESSLFLLNDIAVDEQSGSIYVSDMLDSSIYHLSGGEFKLWLSDPALENPNGLYIENGQLRVASWGIITDLPTFGTDILGHVLTVGLNDKIIQDYGISTPLGNLDGIVSDGNGNYFLTNWRSGELLHYNPKSGISTVIRKLTEKVGAADLDFIPEQKLLLIPLSEDNRVEAYVIE